MSRYISRYYLGTDLEIYQVGFRELHKLSIIHGDLNRDNIFTSEGVKFIDFEDSRVAQVVPTIEEIDH